MAELLTLTHRLPAQAKRTRTKPRTEDERLHSPDELVGRELEELNTKIHCLSQLTGTISKEPYLQGNDRVAALIHCVRQLLDDAEASASRLVERHREGLEAKR